MKTAAKKPIDISSIGASISLKVVSDVERYDFHGTVSMGSNYAITASGTPVDGMTVELWFWTTITPGANTFTILGTVINPKTITGHFVALCRYNGDLSVWMVAAAAVPKEVDGVGITTDANGNISIKPLGIVDVMIAAAAAIGLGKLAALSFSQMVGSDGAGKLVSLDPSTYPSLEELIHLKGVSSALQTQLNNIVSTFASYTTSADLATLLSNYALTSSVASAISSALSSYSTTADMNSAISSAIAAAKPLVGKGILGAGTTTLDATALDYYLVGTDLGAATINLPPSADKDDGFVLTIKLTGGNTASSVIQTQSSNILYSIINTSVANITGMGNGSWYKLRNHKGTGAAGSWEIMEYVTI